MPRKSKKNVAVVAENVEVIETNPGEFSTTVGIETAELPPIDEVTLTVVEPTDPTVTIEGATFNVVEGAVLEPTAEEVESVVRQLEALESQEPEAPAPTSEIPSEPESFEALRESFPDEDVDHMVTEIAADVDERVAYEERKNPDNTNIQRTLTKARAQLVTKRAAKVLLATAVDPRFINRSTHEGARYNVYALGKLADIVRGVTDGEIGNAINNACMRSLFRCAKAGVAFTGELAKACASDKIRVDAAVRQHLVRHTVSASTAPTQASSTMQALETLGVVRVEGSRKSPTYRVTDSPLSRFLEAKLAA